MNQKIAFYLLSIIAIFFIGHYYSQFNISPVKPEIIIINNDEVVFKKTKTDTEAKTLITLKYNERDGHYLLITNRRCDILKKNLEKYKVIKIGSIELKTSDLEFTQLPKSSNTKINCKKIQEISNELVVLKANMAKKLKENFRNDIALDNYMTSINLKLDYCEAYNEIGSLYILSKDFNKAEYYLKKAIEICDV